MRLVEERFSAERYRRGYFCLGGAEHAGTATGVLHIHQIYGE